MDDSRYHITMAFGFHWIHFKKWCNSFILRCKYLHCSRNCIHCNSLNLLWKNSYVDIKMCQWVHSFSKLLCGCTKNTSLKPTKLREKNWNEYFVQLPGRRKNWSPSPWGSPKVCNSFPGLLTWGQLLISSSLHSRLVKVCLFFFFFSYRGYCWAQCQHYQFTTPAAFFPFFFFIFFF